MLSMALKLMYVIFLMGCVHTSVFAADARMQVDVVAETQDLEVQWLHANVREAAALALPQLWDRIVPQYAHALIPRRLQAVRFLQKASPTEIGIRITFNQQRVINYLQQNDLPYIAEQPALHVVVQLYNELDRPMRETTHELLGFANKEAVIRGYRVDDQGATLVMMWRWLDYRRVTLSVRGNSKLNEFSETREFDPGDPLEQLKPWMTEVLLQARDAYAESTMVETETALLDPDEFDLMAGVNSQPVAKPEIALRLTIQRSASLLDQILFENDLKHDPRILNLSLHQVSETDQQYRLALKGSDDQWLIQWFARRGMALTPTIEGWVAH